MKNFPTFEAMAACAGQEVALTDWTTITQPQINQFASATGDHQWIHVDEARARTGPFGSTVAHGFLTLALIPQFLASAVQVQQPGTAVNYGLGKVRFPSPVPVGSRLRARLGLLTAQPVASAGPPAVQITWQVQIERENSDKPVCVAELLVRYYPQ